MNKPSSVEFRMLSSSRDLPMKPPGFAARKFFRLRLMDFAGGIVYLFLATREKMACKAKLWSLQWLAGGSGILLAGGWA